jgi:hypothetical protein
MMRPMRFIWTILLFTSMNCFALSEANCHLVNGVYNNSSNILNELKFSTIVDIFSLTNANTLSMNLDGEDLKFVRSDLVVNRIPRMIYKVKRKNKILKTVFVMLDRNPKDISETKEFYGNMIIPSSSEPKDKEEISSGKSLVYNFYCRF